MNLNIKFEFVFLNIIIYPNTFNFIYSKYDRLIMRTNKMTLLLVCKTTVLYIKCEPFEKYSC